MDENINSILEIDNSKNQQVLIPPSIGVLRIFAWLNLIISLILAIVIWSTLSSKEIIKGSYYSYTEKVADPIMIGLGIGILLQGIFVCALFLVIAHIAESLIYIQNNTKK